jgi:hypothetical protein
MDYIPKKHLEAQSGNKKEGINMKKITYIVESRKTKTNDFLSDSGYARFKDAKEYFNKLVDDKRYYKGETILLIKQTCLFDKEGEFIEILEEEIKKEIEL